MRAAQHDHAGILPAQLGQPFANAAVVFLVLRVAQVQVARIGNAQLIEADVVLQIIRLVVAAQLAADGDGGAHGPGPAAFEHRAEIVRQAHEAHVGFGQVGGGLNEVAEEGGHGGGRLVASPKQRPPAQRSNSVAVLFLTFGAGSRAVGP